MYPLISSDSFTDSVKCEVNKVIRELFRHSYIMPKKFDTKSLTEVKNPIHEVCFTYEDYIRECLSIFDIDLNCTSIDSIYYLSGEKIQPLQPSFDIIKAALLIRQIYKEKVAKFNVRELCFTKLEFREKAAAVNLFTDRITDRAWCDILTFFKNHNMITYQGRVNDLRDDDRIYIYASIALYVSPNVIRTVSDMISSSNNQKSEIVLSDGSSFDSETTAQTGEDSLNEFVSSVE